MPSKIDLDINKIKELYESGYTFLEIAKKHNVSRDTVRSRLRKCGIFLKTGRKAIFFDVKKMYNLYETGISAEQLCEEINCSPYTIKKEFKRQGYQLRRQGPRRKISINDDCFSVLNKSNCYWAGFIAADGCVQGNQLGIHLKVDDYNHLEKFKDFIKLKGSSIFVRNNGKNDGCCIRFRSNQIVKDLENNFNIVPKKSLILRPPNIDYLELSRHFIRGYFDGDGCFSVSLKNMHFEVYSGSYEILEWILNILKTVINTKTEVKRKKGNVYRIIICGNRQVKKIMDWLYIDCNNNFLERKKTKYKEIIGGQTNYGYLSGYGIDLKQ